MSKNEKQHYNNLHQLGCIVCLSLNYGYSEPEIHHTRNHTGLGKRSNYIDAIALCPKHHRTGGLGVAFHAGRKTWEYKFGTQIELLEKTTELLNGRKS